jgi:hypothetical protein
MKMPVNDISLKRLYELAGRYGWQWILDNVWICGSKDFIDMIKAKAEAEKHETPRLSQ